MSSGRNSNGRLLKSFNGNSEEVKGTKVQRIVPPVTAFDTATEALGAVLLHFLEIPLTWLVPRDETNSRTAYLGSLL
jgi:hypothetical protein